MSAHGRDNQRRGLSRRALLRSAGAAGLTSTLLGRAPAAEAQAGATDVLPFAGAHQQGITTPQQSALTLGAFNLRTGDAGTLRMLMKSWSAAAQRMTAGLPATADGGPGRAPGDNNETLDLKASRLTITFGFGPGVFALPGLSGQAPAGLAPLPHIGDERLDHARSGGDLAIQACADDPMVAHHAVRTLYRMAGSAVHLRWIQQGFMGSVDAAGSTPRNLMGFKDGTMNPRDAATLNSQVWVGGSPGWLRDGTYMVFRRILMNLPHWDNTALGGQQSVIGRVKASGAPVGGQSEFDPPNPSALPLRSHVRLAHPSLNGGIQILRRGYAYDEGVRQIGPVSARRPRSRQPDFDAGLAFIAFMRDPHGQFVPLQRRLAANDALNTFIDHVGSAVFAIPPGASPNGYVGETLLG